MSDPYRITDASAPPSGGGLARREPHAGRSAMRALLWLGVFAGVGVNMAANITGHTLVGVFAGGFGTLCIVGLVVSYVKGRRR